MPEIELNLARDLQGVAHPAIMNDEVFGLALAPLRRLHRQSVGAGGADLVVRQLLPAHLPEWHVVGRRGGARKRGRRGGGR